MPRLLLAFNLVGAVAAFAANEWAAHVGDRGLRVRYRAVALLAAAYVVVIAAQLAVWPEVDEWVIVARGVGIVAWPVVWVWPAVQTTRRWRAIRSEVVETINTAREVMGEDPIP